MIMEMRNYLGEVSVLGTPAPLLALGSILGIDLVLTLIHSVEELKGRLWNYFGAIAGIRVPDWLGIPTFSIALTLALWALGFVGLAGGLSALVGLPDRWAVAAIGGIIGARVADGVLSHLRLDRAGYRPNPGLRSTPYYFAEAVILAVLFFPGLSSRPGWAVGGFVVAVLFFWSVLPGLRLARKILVGPFRALREEPWEPRQTRPEWAK